MGSLIVLTLLSVRFVCVRSTAGSLQHIMAPPASYAVAVDTNSMASSSLARSSMPASPMLGSSKLKKVEIDQDNEKSVRAAAPTLSFSSLQGMLGGVEVFAAQARRPIEEVRDDIAKVKTRLIRRNRFLVDPQSRLMQYFDLLAAFGLLYTITVTPYEVGYLGLRWPPDGLFAVNQVVNAIFICDMFLYFVRPVRINGVGERGWVKDHREIARRYLKSFFLVDLVSVLPFDSLGNLVASVEEEASASASLDEGTSESSLIMLTRFLRLVRLLKLARILRASRIINRWDAKISISYATRTLIQWTLILLSSLHLFACVWGTVAWMSGSMRTKELARAVELRMEADDDDGWCTGCVATNIRAEICSSSCLSECEIEVLAEIQSRSTAFIAYRESWICRLQREGVLQRDVPVEQYFHALSSWHSDATFAQNTSEKIVNFILFFLFEFVWAVFTGSICGTIANLDPHGKEFKQRMDSLNNFIKDTQVPNGLSVRVRDYFRQAREMSKRRSYSDLYANMSPGLRGEIVRQLSRRTLEAVWYFRDLAEINPDFLVHLARLLEPSAIAMRETIFYVQQLAVITLGVAGRGGEMLCAGQYWGEDMIVTSLTLRDTRNSTAITYVEIMSLTIGQLEAAMANFPDAQAELRRAANRIAMKRAVMLIAGFIRLSKLQQEFKQSVAESSFRRSAINGTAGAAATPAASSSGKVVPTAMGVSVLDHPQLMAVDDIVGSGRSSPIPSSLPAPVAATEILPPSAPTVTTNETPAEKEARLEAEMRELLQSINGQLPWRDINAEGEVVDEEGNLIDHTFGKEGAQASTADLQRQLVNDARAARKERTELNTRMTKLSDNMESMAKTMEQILSKMTAS